MTENPAIANLLTEAETLGRQGALDQAAALYLQAAAKGKNDVASLLAAAKGLESIKRYGKAHEVYMAALKAGPENYVIHSRLGALYVTIDQVPAALKHFEKALALKPGDPDILFNFALARQSNNDMEGAVTLLHVALEAGGDRRLIFGSLAEIYEQTNALDELRELLGPALKEFPNDGYLNFIAAKMERREGDPAKALPFIEKVATGDEAGDMEMMVCFEKGRIYDKMDDVGRAYANFARGNEICLEQNLRADASKEFSLEQIQNYRALDYAGWRDNAAPAIAENYQSPAFLIGFPRSGTTLLHQILDGHPGLEILEERPLIPVIKHHLIQKMESYPGGLGGLDEAVFANIQNNYVKASEEFRAKGKKTKIVDKLPLNLIDVPLILKIFPNAKFIVALRHPCDCTLSCFMQNFGINNAMLNFTNLDDATKYYHEVFALWRKYRDELEPDFHYIRYEDVVANLEGEARKVIKFLGLDWDDNVLDYQKQALAKKRIATPSYHQVVKPIYKDAKGRWTRYREFLEPYLDRVAPFAKELGYDI